jgi:hypothetical protein
MKAVIRATAVLLAAGGVAAVPVMAAQPAEKANEKAAKRAAFLRGDAATRKQPQVQPSNEQEALRTRRQVAPGVIEMKLPEDRMLNLVLVRHADGTSEIVHEPLDGAPASRKQEAARE